MYSPYVLRILEIVFAGSFYVHFFDVLNFHYRTENEVVHDYVPQMVLKAIKA